MLQKEKSIHPYLPSEVHGPGSTLLGAHATNTHGKCLPWGTALIQQHRQHRRSVTLGLSEHPSLVHACGVADDAGLLIHPLTPWSPLTDGPENARVCDHSRAAHKPEPSHLSDSSVRVDTPLTFSMEVGGWKREEQQGGKQEAP